MALSAWKNVVDLLFVVYGNNRLLGQFLREKVEHFLSGNGVRSTHVPISKLVNDFEMTVYVVNKTPDELFYLFQKQNGCRKIERESIKSILDGIDTHN